jgi:hypothetical protein
MFRRRRRFFTPLFYRILALHMLQADWRSQSALSNWR